MNGASDAAFDRIIVIVTRQIGDVLLTTPLIHAAKKRWPEARIDVLGFAGTLGMLRGNPDVGQLIEVPAGSGWGASLPLIWRLWRRYDLALIAQYTDRAHLYGWVAARVRAGQVPAGRQSWWKRALLKHAVELGAGHSHVVLEKLKLLEPWLGAPADVVVHAPPAAPLPDSLLAVLQPRYVVVQVPSLVRYKQWPPEHYAELARQLAVRGHQVILTGGPSAQDRALVADVARAADRPNVVDAAGLLDLNQMVSLLAGAALYIGPDTSITHLAAACGVPVLALYGPIDPQLWGAWPNAWSATQPYERRALRQQRANIVLLQGTPPCVPCNRAGCDNHAGSRSECLQTMSPERVLAEALGILGS